jgi:rubredoxin
MEYQEMHQCIICGYLVKDEEFQSLPSDYECPECGGSKEDFELV